MLSQRSLRGNNVTHCNIVCRVYLDIGLGTTEANVEFSSTLDPVLRKQMSSLTRHWARYNRTLCGVQLDIGPITMESDVEFSSTLDPVLRKPMSRIIRHWTQYNRK